MKQRTGIAFTPMFRAVVSGVALLLAGSLLAQPNSPGKPVPAPQQAQKLSASAIQVERTEPTTEDLVIPESFRVATYENVILQLEKTKKFQHIYRSGDTTAASVPDLIILRMIPQSYKAGSQKAREVTTVKGSTKITLKVQFTSKDGKVLLEKDVEGKVRFFGENLRATYDFAKKVASIVNDNF